MLKRSLMCDFENTLLTEVDNYQKKMIKQLNIYIFFQNILVIKQCSAKS
jgi:hypothetical protein